MQKCILTLILLISTNFLFSQNKVDSSSVLLPVKTYNGMVKKGRVLQTAVSDCDTVITNMTRKNLLLSQIVASDSIIMRKLKLDSSTNLGLYLSCQKDLTSLQRKWWVKWVYLGVGAALGYFAF